MVTSEKEKVLVGMLVFFTLLVKLSKRIAY